MIDRGRFYTDVRGPIFGGRISPLQFKRIDAVLDGLDQRKLSVEKCAYVLATAHWESDKWQAMTEYASGKAYEGRADLGNVVAGDGPRFRGRGLVMITGRDNYRDWSKRLKVDFLADPELVTYLRHAVPILIDGMILGTFTGHRLADYFNATMTGWVMARRIINRLDKAPEIAEIAKSFHKALS